MAESNRPKLTSPLPYDPPLTVGLYKTAKDVGTLAKKDYLPHPLKLA